MATIEKRRTQAGTKFRAKIRLKGHRSQSMTCERLTDARKWVQQVESAIREGRHFKSSEARKHTVAEMIDRYVATVLPQKPKSASKQAAQLTWWRDRLGCFVCADLTPSLIAEHRDVLAAGVTSRGKPRSPATVVRYLAALSHVLTVAVNEWGWLEDSPMRKVNKPKESRGRVRFLTDDERSLLLAACRKSSHPDLLTIVVIALSTGMRQSEILFLAWPRIDLHNGFLLLDETKNGLPRKVFLSGQALAALVERSKVRHMNTDLVFPAKRPRRLGAHVSYQPTFFRKAWAKAVEDAGLTDFRFHDLRHSTASYLAMNGASLPEIAEVLGHKSLQMSLRYTHLSEGHVRGVLSRMNERFLSNG